MSSDCELSTPLLHLGGARDGYEADFEGSLQANLLLS